MAELTGQGQVIRQEFLKETRSKADLKPLECFTIPLYFPFQTGRTDNVMPVASKSYFLSEVTGCYNTFTFQYKAHFYGPGIKLIIQQGITRAHSIFIEDMYIVKTDFPVITL